MSFTCYVVRENGGDKHKDSVDIRSDHLSSKVVHPQRLYRRKDEQVHETQREYKPWQARIAQESLQWSDDHARQATTPERGHEWLPALGALKRGQMAREKDTIISLLPVGTEEAYQFQKATAFSDFARNLAIGVALFFVLAYAGTFVFMLSLKTHYAETLSTLAVSPASSEVVAQEARAREFNALVHTTAALAAESPLWSAFLESLRSSVTDGITLSNLTIGEPTQPIAIAGKARTRADLNTLRDALHARADLSEIELPLTNLELRADIPFTLSFKLADPAIVYTQ